MNNEQKWLLGPWQHFIKRQQTAHLVQIYVKPPKDFVTQRAYVKWREGWDAAVLCFENFIFSS